SKARSLSEKKSMACLEQFGVDLPERWYARNDLDLSDIAKKTRYPCVLKLVEPMLNHKSDSGGVVVNITSEHQLQEAWKDMQKKLGATEVMIAEQIEKGVEVLVGCMCDDTFGLRLTIGAGGIWTNFIQDAVTLIPPFTD